MVLLKRLSVKEQIYKIIRDKILNQEYGFGDKININRLSQELQVSNTPIREALTMLEMDGLVVTTPNTGSRVFEFTKESYKELTETLCILFIGGYQLCISKNKTDELISMMHSKLEHQKKLYCKKNNSEFAKAAVAFDESLLIVPQNRRLISIFDGLLDMLFLAVLYDYQYNDTGKKASIIEHEKILEAISNGENEKVVVLIKEHYDRQILFQR